GREGERRQDRGGSKMPRLGDTASRGAGKAGGGEGRDLAACPEWPAPATGGGGPGRARGGGGGGAPHPPPAPPPPRATRPKRRAARQGSNRGDGGCRQVDPTPRRQPRAYGNRGDRARDGRGSWRGVDRILTTAWATARPANLAIGGANSGRSAPRRYAIARASS